MAINAADKYSVQLVGAVLLERGNTLLGLRAPHRRSCPNCWDVIGGHVEYGESLIDAVIRELNEEIGITATQPRAFRSLMLDDLVEGRSLLHLFLVDEWAGTPTVVDDEHTQIRWFAPSAAARLPNLAVPEYRSVFSSLPDIDAPDG